MNIPLVNDNSVDAINTSLIAIKKTVNSNNQIQDVDVNVGINIATNCTYCAASSTTIKGAQLYNGCSIKVLFTSAITGSDTTTPMSINYNGVSIPVKTGKNGVLSNFVANNINGTYIYCQAYTTLELLFDGTQFIIMGNPVVISSADYTIYTDGAIKYTKTGTDNLFKPYNQLTNISFKGAKAVVKLNANSSTTFDFSKLAGTYYNQSKTFVFQFIGWSEQYGAINMVTRTTSSSWSVNLVTNFTLTLSRQDNSVTISNDTLYACIVEIEVIAIF